MSTLKIILSSTRPGSIAPAIGSWIADTAGRSGDFDAVEVLDLAEINLPFLDEPQHPKLGRYTKPHTLAWAHAVDTADALVIVTPEYNAGFPAPLKNALDFLHAEWCNKALGMVTYGGGLSGGARAANMLAPVTDALGLVTARHAVAIARAPRQVVGGEFVATPTDDAAARDMLAELARIDGELAPRRAALAVA
jgi:NAD(P)H-dependent FMN reductase